MITDGIFRESARILASRKHGHLRFWYVILPNLCLQISLRSAEGRGKLTKWTMAWLLAWESIFTKIPPPPCNQGPVLLSKFGSLFPPTSFFGPATSPLAFFVGALPLAPSLVTRLFGSNILSQNLLPSTKWSVFKSIKVIYSRFSRKIGLQITQKVKCPNHVRWTFLNVWISRTGYLGRALVFTCRTWSGN